MAHKVTHRLVFGPPALVPPACLVPVALTLLQTWIRSCLGALMLALSASHKLSRLIPSATSFQKAYPVIPALPDLRHLLVISPSAE